eukprot:TRINITY_DN29346_c0_g1_i1.p1 TRINITY_DN29346_c0_g1~~TRINITY_DN29346_c0_g1_i1.p1  ORF type:complete len:166 (+),score=9.07 TRINITY_DN29346_c0_g1_i1:101-598(+)
MVGRSSSEHFQVEVGEYGSIPKRKREWLKTLISDAEDVIVSRRPHCVVTRHISLGCAVASLASAHVQEAVLACARRRQDGTIVIDVGGFEATMVPHFDKATKQLVPTDLFIAWSRREGASKLKASVIAERINSLVETVLSQTPARELAPHPGQLPVEVFASLRMY